MGIDLKTAFNRGFISIVTTDKVNNFLIPVKRGTEYEFYPVVFESGMGCVYGIPDTGVLAKITPVITALNKLRDITTVMGKADLTALLGVPTPADFSTVIKGVLPVPTTAAKKGYKILFTKGMREALIKAGYTVDLACEAPLKKADFTKSYAKYKELGITDFDKFAEIAKEDEANYEDIHPELKAAFNNLALAKGPKVLIVTGPSSSGKSYGVKLACLHHGMKFIETSVSTSTRDSTLVGSIIPNADGTAEKPIIWKNGPFVTGVENGFTNVINEGNCSEDIQYLFYQIGDTSNTINVEGRKDPIKIDDNFRLIITLNPGADYTFPLTEAFKSRCIFVTVPAWTEKKFIDLMQTKSRSYHHEFSKNFFKELFTVANTIQSIGTKPPFRERFIFGSRTADHFLTGILGQSCSYEQFKYHFYTAYINMLNTDYDNTANVESLKNDPTIEDHIKTLYSYYDFKAIDFADDCLGSIEDCICDDASVTEEKSEDEIFETVDVNAESIRKAFSFRKALKFRKK